MSPMSTLVAAGFAALGLAGDVPRPSEAGNVLYCTGCLCQADRPAMPVPGTWVRSGTMGQRITLRFVPREASAAPIAGRCAPRPRG